MLLRESVVELEAGSVLAGRFQIRRVLGKGATGVVLEADDRVSRSLVALKVFKPEIATDDRWQEIVGSELRHARQIMHPNVCRVFDAGEADGYRFLSMEFASGGSLRQRLKEGTNRSFEERVADARAVVNGLAAIHTAGMIHRDVKPDNVLLMEDGRLVMTDFGLAVAPGQTTFMSGYSGAVGTPSYMAPEVALGGDASMASDVFSLGVILHEIFFDRRPAWETTRRGRFLKSPVDRHRSRRLRLVARLCRECLDDLAPRRPQNAEQVSRRFERAVLGRYGSIVGAIGRGKWGLAVGLGVAAAVAGSMYLATKPADGARRLKIVGTAADLPTQAAIVAKTRGYLRCLAISADGTSARVIWGSPPVPEQIDLGTGATGPWPIVAEAVQGGSCPQLSPDERRLVYTIRSPSEQVVLSPNSAGGAARFVTAGYAPQWLPNAHEIAYFFGNRRVGVIGNDQVPRLLPEAGGVDDLIMSVAISPIGDRIATVMRAGNADDSLVTVYEYPSLVLSEEFRVPAMVSASSFAPSGRGLDLLADGPGGFQALRSADGVVRRRVRMAESDIVRIASNRSITLLGVQRKTATLFVSARQGTEQAAAHARSFGRMSSSARGEILVEEEALDGRRLVGLYDPSLGYVRLTSGPRDREPLFAPDGKQFAYIDWPDDRVLLCNRNRPPTCRTLVRGDKVAWLSGFSPSGRQLAYLAMVGASLRLRSLSVTDGRVTDFGYGSVSRCRVRWRDERAVWVFSRSERSASWEEIDAGRLRPTGRTEPAGPLGADGCPVEAEAQASARIDSAEEASIWMTRD
jgi:hypothetical protein